MPRVLLSSVGIWAIGCIIPTPLEAEPNSLNRPPSIVRSIPDFRESPVGVTQSSDVRRFEVQASDPDNGEEQSQRLIARFYRKERQVFGLAGEIRLSNAGTGVQSGTFVEQPCLLSTERQPLLYVFVADKDFPEDFNPSGDPNDTFTDHFDFGYWVIQCPAT